MILDGNEVVILIVQSAVVIGLKNSLDIDSLDGEVWGLKSKPHRKHD